MFAMFGRSEFNQDISEWDVSNVKNIAFMFQHSKFTQDISYWTINIRDKKNYVKVFDNCPIEEDNKPYLRE